MENQKIIYDDCLKYLIAPYPRKERTQLELTILSEGSNEPIITWNNIIVDGHKRYEICKRNKIPVIAKEQEFECIEAVIVWICANQLKRTNLSEETRKYLIGMQFENEKIITKMHAKYRRNHIAETDVDVTNDAPNRQKSAQTIALANNISIASVQKYSVFARSVEKIRLKEPKLVSKILSGQYRLSHSHVIDMADLTKEELQRINRKIEMNPREFMQYRTSRNSNETGKFEAIPTQELMGPSVKDMPEYDPDAEIKSLALTIPSWQSSIERAKRNTDFSQVSEEAKSNLKTKLHSLSMTIVHTWMEMEDKK